MHAPLNGVSTTPILLILACCHAGSILISSPNTLAPFVVSFVDYYNELSPLPCHHPHIHAWYYYAFHSSTTSPPFRSNPTIPNDILCIWSTIEPPKHSSCWLMGYFQYPTLYSVNCCGGDNKAAALIPGAAHDRRAATERSTESTDEIGSAARRGSHSGWRPSMMNEAGSVRHRWLVFRLCLCAPKKNAVPGTHSFTSPGVHCQSRNRNGRERNI